MHYALAVTAACTSFLLPICVSAAPLPDFDVVCQETQLEGCTVQASGYVVLEEGQGLAYQTQQGFTGEDGLKGGVVLFQETPAGWVPFATAFDGYRYEVPRIVEHERTLLHVAGYTGGSGAYNADLLFALSDGEWRPIDITSWTATIGTKLPSGLEIWKGVDFDFGDWFYSELEASTPLWRAEDGNCCPSGGWATIHFAVDNWTLMVTGVDHQPPPKAK